MKELTAEERTELINKLRSIAEDLEKGHYGFTFLHDYICNDTWMGNGGHVVAYLCDGYGCERKCAEEDPDERVLKTVCQHTLDIRHAVNFTDAFGRTESTGLYMEIPEELRDKEE